MGWDDRNHICLYRFRHRDFDKLRIRQSTTLFSFSSTATSRETPTVSSSSTLTQTPALVPTLSSIATLTSIPTTASSNVIPSVTTSAELSATLTIISTPTNIPGQKLLAVCNGLEPLEFTDGLPMTDPCSAILDSSIFVPGFWIVMDPLVGTEQHIGRCLYRYPVSLREGIIKGLMQVLPRDDFVNSNLPDCPETQPTQ